MRKAYGLVLICFVSVLVGAAHAQEFPSRPMTMIIPFPAGGNADGVGRVVAHRMGELLGQRVVVENVGGAGGMIGSNRVAQAAPDGYTFVLGTTGTHAQGQTLFKAPLYNVVTDFTPLALIAEVPIALIVRKDLPVADFKEFIGYARANQAKMQYGSAGPGSAVHLGCVVLNSALGTNVTHVPYKGSGPAMQDLLAGRLDYMCEFVSVGKPHVDSGSLRALVVMAKERSPAMPSVPTGAELGFPSLEAYTWNAFFLPKNTPAPIVKRLNEAVSLAVDTQSVRRHLERLGVAIVPSERRSPEYLARFVRAEIEKWAVPIRAAGIAGQ
jgi:tripartite-type tricarboxylate transporter receptor subunit TctC